MAKELDIKGIKKKLSSIKASFLNLSRHPLYDY